MKLQPRAQKLLLAVLLAVAAMLSQRSYAQYQAVVQAEDLFNEGEALQHKGDLRGAIAVYQRAYQRNPLFFPAYEAAADVHRLGLREGREAIRILEEAQQHIPADPRLHRALGECYLASGLPEYRERAVAMLRLAASEAPEDLTCKGLLLQAQKRSTDASSH